METTPATAMNSASLYADGVQRQNPTGRRVCVTTVLSCWSTLTCDQVTRDQVTCDQLTCDQLTCDQVTRDQVTCDQFSCRVWLLACRADLVMATEVYGSTTSPNPKSSWFIGPSEILCKARFVVKVLEVLLSFVAFILEEVVNSCVQCSALYFFEFVSCTAFLFTLLLLVLLSTTLHTRVGITCWPSLVRLTCHCLSFRHRRTTDGCQRAAARIHEQTPSSSS
ncbi:CKLF-like MARVEL transmembrane domain-containing protein 6 [Nibea albiflora]|nr:CKLF-like MARVEL transmembrane domain-containing protein 6 [Nibea albiflora]